MHIRMRNSSFNFCLLLVCIYQTADASGRPESRLLKRDRINFPRKTLTKTQVANCVLNKRLFSIYQITNPPFATNNFRDIELVFTPQPGGNLSESWDLRIDGVCASGLRPYEPVTDYGSRAVYTSEPPFPTTGQGITASFFSSHPRDYVFIFFCLDRAKEIVRNGKRVYCDGPWSIVFLTYKFPPNQVKWCAAERDLWKTFGLTFDYELTRFDPTFERCSQEPLPP